MTTRARFARLFDRLTALRVRSRKAGELQAELEHELMRIVTADGLRAVERLLTALEVRDGRLALTDEQPTRRMWRQELANGRRELRITVVKNRLYRTTHVLYERVRKVRLTPRRQRIHVLQEAFYARYMAVGQKAYRDPSYRLTPPDRLLLLIGELEANGGFDQYLGNHGRRRAQAALAALLAVGARKTAVMLEMAMSPGATAERLSALDERFYRVPEDLAILTARHVGLKSS